MTQQGFDFLAAMPRVVRRPLWRVTGDSSCTRRHDHEDGWAIVHCGHPTALRPWTICAPDGEVVRAGVRRVTEARELLRAMGVEDEREEEE